jgi:hypothetical protein
MKNFQSLTFVWSGSPDIRKSVCSSLGSEVLTAVVMNVAIFSDITPCSPMWTVVSEELINSILRVQSWPTKKPARKGVFRVVTCCTLFLFVRLILEPEDGKHTFLRNVCSHTQCYIPEDVNIHYVLLPMSLSINYEICVWSYDQFWDSQIVRQRTRHL